MRLVLVRSRSLMPLVWLLLIALFNLAAALVWVRSSWVVIGLAGLCGLLVVSIAVAHFYLRAVAPSLLEETDESRPLSEQEVAALRRDIGDFTVEPEEPPTSPSSTGRRRG